MQDPGKLAFEYQSRLALSGQDDSDQEADALRRERRRLDKAADRFLGLYGDERIDWEQLDNRLDENTARKKMINGQLQTLDRGKQEDANQQQMCTDLRAFCDSVNSGLDNLTEEERQKLLRLLVERVTIERKSIRIELAVPLDNPQAVYRLCPTCHAVPLRFWAGLFQGPLLFTVAAFVLLAAVARALGVAANLALIWLHGALLVAESTGASRRMIAIPIGPSSHDFPDRLGLCQGQ